MTKDKSKGFFVPSERKEPTKDAPGQQAEKKKPDKEKGGIDIDKLPKYLGDGVGSVS